LTVFHIDHSKINIYASEEVILLSNLHLIYELFRWSLEEIFIFEGGHVFLSHIVVRFHKALNEIESHLYNVPYFFGVNLVDSQIQPIQPIYVPSNIQYH
jgi:hypothetical protein